VKRRLLPLRKEKNKPSKLQKKKKKAKLYSQHFKPGDFLVKEKKKKKVLQKNNRSGRPGYSCQRNMGLKLFRKGSSISFLLL
jgi:hypothetical protein